ncbi:hypothetical protein BCR37DRAFT_375968 [Protomyces lactucae-debilis]|uniref:Membrane-associated proteins in eicosanoid and glutathione metabolism n=1 Tax=Protomyces lactucae-debilis TaxID=2754530 RepID=A0A1Y2FXG5_PROLT|nr:uncharacterized protein BCR37DRAFT_375968 [Protomyces lactucae-debilis]ORY87984.1 hypothetical protein BCR37DRAFT_375968 [Protomyces lactucae-debilis]
MLAAIGTSFVGVWHSMAAGGARKAAGIKYPQTFATPEQEKASKEALIFNCMQRAHANFNESLPIYLLLLAVASVRFPAYASAASAVWLVGRVMYTLGYRTGDPAKRMQGSAQYIGLLSLLGLAITSTYRTLGY